MGCCSTDRANATYEPIVPKTQMANVNSILHLWLSRATSFNTAPMKIVSSHHRLRWLRPTHEPVGVTVTVAQRCVVSPKAVRTLDAFGIVRKHTIMDVRIDSTADREL